MNKKLSRTYRLMRKMGLNFSEEEYGQITIMSAIKKALSGWWYGMLLHYCMHSAILGNLNYRKIRPILWRWMGAKVGKDVFIGYDVWIDQTNANLIEVGDYAHITTRCLLLCHKRDLKNYCVGDNSATLLYSKKKIVIGKGVMLGMGTIVMPGVTIGEGSMIGAGSLVTSDIPVWSLAVGSPAKVVKNIPLREQLSESL